MPHTEQHMYSTPADVDGRLRLHLDNGLIHKAVSEGGKYIIYYSFIADGREMLLNIAPRIHAELMPELTARHICLILHNAS